MPAPVRAQIDEDRMKEACLAQLALLFGPAAAKPVATLAINPALVTLPVSLFNLDLAVGTLPAAMVMRRFGRRTGYVLGASIGSAAGLVAALGVFWASFAIFCVGTSGAGPLILRP